ncbi:unnamed protein product, partial [Brassica rapa subsp. trilocularis]
LLSLPSSLRKRDAATAVITGHLQLWITGVDIHHGKCIIPQSPETPPCYRRFRRGINQGEASDLGSSRLIN